MNYYFDMDGVITVYERWAFRGGVFLELESHYFRTCKPDYKVIEAIRVLNQCNNVNVYILTSVASDVEIRKEQVDDKILWLSDNCPFLDISKQFIPVISGVSKAKYVSSTKDVLIDDYNTNLLEWKNAGGTAVKYLNGVNSYNSFKNGCMISKDMSVDEIVSCLKSIEYFLKVGV